jgi:hypothetical protein
VEAVGVEPTFAQELALYAYSRRPQGLQTISLVSLRQQDNQQDDDQECPDADVHVHLLLLVDPEVYVTALVYAQADLRRWRR